MKGIFAKSLCVALLMTVVSGAYAGGKTMPIAKAVSNRFWNTLSWQKACTFIDNPKVRAVLIIGGLAVVYQLCNWASTSAAQEDQLDNSAAQNAAAERPESSATAPVQKAQPPVAQQPASEVPVAAQASVAQQPASEVPVAAQAPAPAIAVVEQPAAQASENVIGSGQAGSSAPGMVKAQASAETEQQAPISAANDGFEIGRNITDDIENERLFIKLNNVPSWTSDGIQMWLTQPGAKVIVPRQDGTFTYGLVVNFTRPTITVVVGKSDNGSLQTKEFQAATLNDLKLVHTSWLKKAGFFAGEHMIPGTAFVNYTEKTKTFDKIF